MSSKFEARISNVSEQDALAIKAFITENFPGVIFQLFIKEGSTPITNDALKTRLLELENSYVLSSNAVTRTYHFIRVNAGILFEGDEESLRQEVIDLLINSAEPAAFLKGLEALAIPIQLRVRGGGFGKRSFRVFKQTIESLL